MQYAEYKYLYPPRPVFKISPDEIIKYDNDRNYIAQPKCDGSCVVLFLSETEARVMNRHNEAITNSFAAEIDYRGLYSGTGYMVLCGELLNKNKLGENGQPFNKKFVIWDIIVYNGIYLIGKTMEERLSLLEQLYPCNRMKVGATIEMYDHLCCTNYTGIYKAATYTGGFSKIYREVTKVQLYEGIVLKRRDAKLTFGFGEKNNYEYTLKCRKETKNYAF